MLFPFLLSVPVLAEEITLIQAGKTFVRGIDEAKAKAIAEDYAEIKKFSFAELKVKQGDTVRFVNSDAVKHNVFLKDTFNFVQPPGSIDTQKFTEKGTYEIKCAIHPKMKIKVIVE